MTQLVKGLNVFIKTSKLILLKRFRNKPKDFARGLLLELISRDELKTMTALGKGKKKGVPEEIREAIYCKQKSLKTIFHFQH